MKKIFFALLILILLATTTLACDQGTVTQNYVDQSTEKNYVTQSTEKPSEKNDSVIKMTISEFLSKARQKEYFIPRNQAVEISGCVIVKTLSTGGFDIMSNYFKIWPDLNSFYLRCGIDIREGKEGSKWWNRIIDEDESQVTIYGRYKGVDEEDNCIEMEDCYILE